MAFILKSLFSKTGKLVHHTQYSGELQNEVYIQGCLGQIPLILCQILQILNHFDSCKERRCTSVLMTNFQQLLAIILLLSKAALAGHKIGQNE